MADDRRQTEENLQEFFRAVRALARKHGFKAHAVCAVTQLSGPGQVHVASDAVHAFAGKDRKYLQRCYKTMGESLDLTLERLDDADEQREMVN